MLDPDDAHETQGIPMIPRNEKSTPFQVPRLPARHTFYTFNTFITFSGRKSVNEVIKVLKVYTFLLYLLFRNEKVPATYPPWL